MDLISDFRVLLTAEPCGNAFVCQPQKIEIVLNTRMGAVMDCYVNVLSIGRVRIRPGA